jgi:hypothetical protein
MYRHMSEVIEAQYPVEFRSVDAQVLGGHLRHHNSVVLIGMKRVGISNFLRFFLHHPHVPEKYIGTEKQQYIVVDLNNLVERTTYAFWMLTLKRVCDEILSGDYPEKVKEESRLLFTQSIQLRDCFFTIEAVQRLLSLIADHGRYINLFLLRFDRLAEVITAEFFANLQGLKDSVAHLSYVMTSYRPLHELVPTVFTRSSLAGFFHEQYLHPATDSDLEIMLTTLIDRYDMVLSEAMKKEILRLASGHAQYLHLLVLKIKHHEELNSQPEKLEEITAHDEEVQLLGEEIFMSLTEEERRDILEMFPTLGKQKRQVKKYLTDTGIVVDGQQSQLFNPLFAYYLDSQQYRGEKTHDFTKKEHALFTLLLAEVGKLVERDKIIESVWPDEVEFGISDWAIDRLVARVRRKLRLQRSHYKIVTVITRGYKLVTLDGV